MESINNLLPIGTLLRNGTYRIERPLGSGGFGNTYLVRHCGLDAMMVVKEFFMKGINLRGTDNTVTVSVPDNRATYESQRDKFKKEAQRLWRLKSDHIVGVHDIFEENGTVYYVMDFIEGESLEDHIRRQEAPMLEHEVRDIMNQLLDALSVIHCNAPTPIFHLDIKPGNILMSKEGRVVLIDFGASKQLSADREGVTSTMITYTRGYAPTEQMDGNPERIGAWTDLYALGATLYKLLTKNIPPDPSEISEEAVDAFHFPAYVNAQMQKLIMWLMQPNRRRRPQSVKEVREWLNNTSKQNQSNVGESSGTKPESEETTFLASSQPIVEEKHPVKSWKEQMPRLRYVIPVLVAIGCIAVVFYTWRSCKSGYDPNPVALSDTLQKKYEHETVQPFNQEELNHRLKERRDSSLLLNDSKELVITANGVSFKMIRVEGASSGTFYIGETEVTQALWQAVMGSNPSRFKGSNRPVEKVSWNDCKEFISRLNSATGKTFRLPKEAEWEYAAKGGSKSHGYEYSGSNEINDVAWYDSNAYDVGDSSPDSGTHNVKTKKANELGIYDTSGNVWEWCEDLYSSSGSNRVLRGGGWSSSAGNCRVSRRYNAASHFQLNDVGLRLAL